MYTFWQTVADTPWWVFVLFLSLVYMALAATKARVITLHQLFLLPFVLLTLSIIAAYTILPLTWNDLFFWLTSMLGGSGFGWIQFKVSNVHAIKKTNHLHLPGTWTVLIFVLILFFIKYNMGYLTLNDPAAFKAPSYRTFIVSVYGLFMGLSLGRLFYAITCLKRGPDRKA